MIASTSIGKAGGKAFENHDERAAVRFAGGEKTQHLREIVYEVSARSGAAHRGVAAKSAAIPAVNILHASRGIPQCIFSRIAFSATADGAIDLATGESRAAVRRSRGARGARTGRARRSAIGSPMLRHPLLLPLVDYGMCGKHWFEAHAALGPLRMTPRQARRAVLHVVRFLRAAGIELDVGEATRNIRTGRSTAPSAGHRPIGVFLRGATASTRCARCSKARGRRARRCWS